MQGLRKIKNNIYFFLVIISVSSCDEVLPPERFIFDDNFLSLFKAVTNKDTLLFENAKHSIDTFVLTTIDSAFSNRVSWLMRTSNGRSITRNYKQYPINYWGTNRFENEATNSGKTISIEGPLISISKGVIDDDKDINMANIHFKSFYCSITDNLDKPSNDTLVIDSIAYSNYYIFNTDDKSIVSKKDDRVESIFISLSEGIIAYKENSGIIRKRINIK